jgi:hypothetical protein
MADIMVCDDGSIRVKRSRDEIADYYNRQIDLRLAAMAKLTALGADPGPVRARIAQLNDEKKARMKGA